MNGAGTTGALAILGAVGGFLALQFAWHCFFKAAESPAGQATIRGLFKIAVGLGLLMLVGMCASLGSRNSDPHGLGAERQAQFNRW